SDYETICDVTNRLLSAEVNINTKQPALNLDNFKDIADIDCSSNQIQVTFHSAEFVDVAVKEWGATPNLALFFPHSRACGGLVKAQAFSVSSMTAAGNKLVIASAPMNIDDVIEDYEMNITQTDLAPAVAKRGFIHQNGNISKSFQLNLNFDPATQSAVKPSIGFDTPFIDAHCINCYAHGSATISLNVKATLLIVNHYELKVDGGFWANLDVDLNAPAAHNKYLLKKNLATIPITPIQAPGVFSFGPELVLDAGITYEVTEDVHFSYGFDVALPFTVTATSNSLLKAPTITKSFTPAINQHSLVRTKDIQVGVAGHLIPGINLDLKIFQLDLIQMDLALDNSLGVNFNTGKFTVCPEDKFDVTLYHEHDLYFDIRFALFKRHIDIYDTGKLPLACFFCKQCKPSDGIPSISSTSTSAHSTSTSVAVTTSSAASSTLLHPVQPTLPPPFMENPVPSLSSEPAYTQPYSASTTAAPVSSYIPTTSAEAVSSTPCTTTLPTVVPGGGLAYTEPAAPAATTEAPAANQPYTTATGEAPAAAQPYTGPAAAPTTAAPAASTNSIYSSAQTLSTSALALLAIVACL
ncbi:hypothetical protein HDU91_003389, partial [Kappamyces sp. JEL0680]